MSKNGYDISVAYRVYPGISKQPVIFPQDKYRLAELCLKSFTASLGKLRVKMWAILDGCPLKYEKLFSRYFNKKDLVFVRLNGEGNAATFQKQIEILTKQDDSEQVYFAEDDYYYLADQIPEMLDFLRIHHDVDFVSPYDHPDYYSLVLHNRVNQIRVSANKHWKSVNSTCLTFLTRKSVLIQTRKTFETYRKRNFDASIWLSLTKQKVRDPIAIARFLSKDLMLFKIIVKAWLFCWRQIVFGQKWTIWVPMPSVATHLERDGLAPGYDWLNAFQLSKRVTRGR